MSTNGLIIIDNIQSRIFTVRGVQVMLDADLAALYNVETRVLNQAVKRNKARFPEQFCFQLTGEEYERLRSQTVTLEKDGSLTSQDVTLEKDGSLTSQDVTLESQRGKHRKYLPYAFTEQGVAMLSAVLRSDVAVEISVKIMDAFVAMRHFILTNAQVLQRLDGLEVWKLETDKKMERVLTALESGEIQPKQGIFYNGQIFDAYIFVSDLFKSAHDRFIIIDDNDLYHFGASLKDLGKKWFAFSKMDIEAVEMLARLEGAGE